MSKPVEILTIKKKIPLFKGEEKAERIELIQLEEVGFELVCQKDLYQIGDKIVYIQPDYCLSDIPLFESYIRPNGDESKSMLGKVEGLPRRIRAKKFNFHKGDGLPVYSEGIGLPVKEVLFFLRKQGKCLSLTINEINLEESLNITKYEAPEERLISKGGIQGMSKPFPQGMYRTDEENINNMWNHLENNIKYPVLLVGTEKIDGSSITLYYKDGKAGICSRNLDKPLTITKITGKRDRTFLEKLVFWKNVDLNIYTEIENDSEFVQIGKPYLDKLVEYCKLTGYDLVLRGELNGKGLKGSGNKNNPSQSEEPNIKFFGADIYKDNTIRLPYDDFQDVLHRCNLQFDVPKTVFCKSFSSKDELITHCNKYFEINMIEGIVVRTLDSSFSAKIMNLYYDSMK